MDVEQHPIRAAYPLAEAQALLGGCSRSHIYNLAERGELRLVRLGRRVLVPADEIRRLTSTPAATGTRSSNDNDSL